MFTASYAPKTSNQTMKPTSVKRRTHGFAGPLAKQLQRVCHNTLDFVSVPGLRSR
jgi:hypothetical protein